MFLTFFDVCVSLRERKPIKYDRVTHIVQAVEAEDGSGRKWNLTLLPIILDADGKAVQQRAIRKYWAEDSCTMVWEQA